MSYDPDEYWARRGRTYYDRFTFERYHQQEDALVEVIRDVFDTDDSFEVLEAGCGFGRIARLLARNFPKVHYQGFDLSADQIQNARTFAAYGNLNFEQSTIADYTDGAYDLVLAVEVLMHVPPADLQESVDKLRGFGPLVTVDWTDGPDIRPKPHNFLHDYEAVGLTPVRTVGNQTIFRG